MHNDSLLLLVNIWLNRLEDIPGWVWGIFGIIGIIITIILGYWYPKKLSNQTEQNIVEKLEHCINERIQASSQGEPASSFCKGVVEDAKRLQNATSNYDRGLSKAALGDLDGAETEFNTAIELQLPVLSKYYFQRGNIRYLQSKFKDSCIDYSETIKINPKLAEAWYNKAITFVKLDKHDEAIKAYDKAIEINPKLVVAWYNKAIILNDLGKHDEAIKAYDTAIEINPKLAEAWYNKAIILDDLGKHDEAIKAYDKAIEINPKLAEAWSNKGITLVKLGKHDEAIKAYDKAIEINPKLVIAWYNKAITLTKLHNHYGASITSREAIEINPLHTIDFSNRDTWYALVGVGRDAAAEPSFAFAKAKELGYKG